MKTIINNVNSLNSLANYFIYRQMDWERNSLQMLTRKYYSQKMMDNKSCQNMHNMLHDKEINWNNMPTYLKRGRCVVKKEEEVEVNNEYFVGNVMRNRWGCRFRYSYIQRQ